MENIILGTIVLIIGFVFIYLLIIMFRRMYLIYTFNKKIPTYKVGDYLRDKESGDDPFREKYSYIKITGILKNHKNEYFIRFKWVYRNGGLSSNTSSDVLYIYDRYDTKNIYDKPIWEE